MLTAQTWVDQARFREIVEIGRKESAVRIEDIMAGPTFLDAYRNKRVSGRPAITGEPAIQFAFEDLKLLHEYLHEQGRVVHISGNVAAQTIQYLKEI